MMGPRDRRERALAWGRAGATAGVLAIVLLFVALVTYLPHMQTLEGEINPSGAVVNKSERDPWTRLGLAYVSVLNGSKDDYEYPMHVDEDVHWVRAAAIQRADSMSYPNPYTGQPPRESGALSLKGSVHEQGFVLAFAQFQELTGIPFILIIRFFPAIFAALTAWLVWVALRPWPGAAVAAALVALIPSSPRFLGIAFWVPIGIGLAWIATGMIVARYATSDRRTLFLALMLGAWAFYIHLIAGFAFLLVFLASIPANLGRVWRDMMTFGALIAVPMVWFFGAFAADFGREAKVLGHLPTDFTIFDQIGIPFLVAWSAGCSLVVLRPPASTYRPPIYAATIASVVSLGLMVTNFVLDLEVYALYDRWHQPMVLFATVPVAYGIVEIVRWTGEVIRSHSGRRAIRPLTMRPRAMMVGGALATVLLGGFVATPGLAAHLDEPYYYFMTDESWERMLAASELGPEYDAFLVHPWQAPIFNALTGKRPHTWLDPGEPPFRGLEYQAYHQGKYSDDVWLVERELTILLEAPGAGPPNYHVGPGGVLLLDSPYVEELAAATHRG